MDDEPISEQAGGGWIGWQPGGDNSHLTDDQRRLVELRWKEEAARRGQRIARVVVDVFEHDAVPFVQFPKGSPIVPADRTATAAAVARAADALRGWS